MLEAKTIRDEIAEAKKKAETIMAAAEKDNREMTAEERGKIQAHLDEAAVAQAKLDRHKGDQELAAKIAALGQGTASDIDPHAQGGHAATRKRLPSLGEQFVRSAAGQWVQNDQNIRSGARWQSPASELMEPRFAAEVLSEDSASGGQLIVADYRPGVLPTLQRRIMVTDLIAPGTTDSNAVIYMQETVFTNAAAAVAEGAEKPQSTLRYEQVTSTVKKIAHWIPVSSEMLSDVSQTRSVVNGRLIDGLDLVEEDQILNGSGTGANLLGLRNHASIHADQARGSDTNADAIHKQITAIMVDTLVFPDGVVIHPTNWETIVLAKDGNGQYYGAGPFAPMQARSIWGLPAAVTPVITLNTALVGAFRTCAQLFRKGGTLLSASNSHEDFFTRNLVALLAERRMALANYRPAGFGEVTGLQ